MDRDSLTAQLDEIGGIFDETAEPLTTPEVADRLGLGRRTAYNRLERLVEHGRLKTKKVGASARIWWRPQPPPEAGDDWNIRAGRSAQVTRVERQFRLLVEATDEYAICLLDPDGYVRTWNPGAARITGYDAEEILDTHVSTFYTEEDRASGIPERNLRAAAHEGSIRGAGWRVRDDGSRFWANVTLTALRDDEGDLIGYATVTRDMSDRKRREAERELQYETTRDIARAETFHDGLRAALQNVCELTDWEYAEVWVPTDDGKLRRTEIEYYEDGFAEFAVFSEGYTFERNEGLPGRVWATGEFEWAADLPSGSFEAYPRRERAIDADLKSSLGVPIVAGDEVVAVLTFLMREIRDTDERLIEVVSSIAADLGELLVRRQIEEEVIHERDLTDQILAVSPIGIQVLNRDGEITRMNDRALEILEIPDDHAESYAPAERATYDADGERVSPEDHPFSRVLATGEAVFDWQARVALPENGHRWLTINAAPVLDAEGEIERVVTTGKDITQLKEQTRRLERQREELTQELDEMFERISDGFYALDHEFRISYVNDHAERLLGLEGSSVIGRGLEEVLSPTAQFDAALQRALEEQTPVRIEEYYEPLDTWFENTVYPSESGISVHFRTITERKERERALQRKERRFQTLIENFPNGAVALVDENVRYTTFGGTPEGETDLTRGDLEGGLLREVLPTELADVVIPGYEKALEGTPSRFVDTVDDRVYQFQFLPVRDEGGDVFLAMAMSQDITERKQREQELQNRIRQQQVVTGLGTRALEDWDLDALLAETTRLVAETLDTDYCKVLDLDADAEEFLLRQGVGWDEDVVGDTTVSAVEDGSQAAYTLTTEEPVLVDDLTTESRFSGPALLRDHDIRSGISSIIGTADDPWGILGTHDSDRREFSEHDGTFVQAVANILAAAIDRHRHEQDLVHQREQLAALNSLNDVIRDITSAVIEQATREEIEETVAERLVGTESYLFAWVGDVDPNTQTVNVRSEAGVEGYLDDITISVDPTDERSEGATGRALRTGEIQATYDQLDDSRYDPWRDAMEEYGFRSSAAVPIVHDDTIYGVLNIYAGRPNAFTGQERTMLTQLGEIVGHAIAAAEQKQALLSDELVELEFQIEDLFAVLDAPVETEETVTFEHTVAIGDGQSLVYGTATPESMESIRGLVETIPYWESVTVRSAGDPTRFELRISNSSVLSVVASRGGYIDSAVIEDGDFRMTIHLAPTVEVRRVIDSVKEVYPGAKMVRRRQFTRVEDEPHPFNRQLVADLTDRQRSAVEAAYHAGYFKWPRDRSGEEVAESLGVSPPTFHLHLRKAERKLFERILSASV
ncbi:PAS domain-containing protein [Halorubrum sp. AD140]|uniref:PAS domain-containing protein n=1 Tax=Halorubrum sp. AD140 TaxID=3050073 RepID=UPI002ACCD613|nr:PAS domain-containing protein [Halorubrum sp. AD140]MDZ5810847.1 PAS domain-containing protein [Halorubrum sp. AD140]